MNIGNLQKFISQVNETGGILLPYRWEFNFTMPFAFRSDEKLKEGRGDRSWFDLYMVNVSDLRKMKWSCSNATIPGRSLSTGAVAAPGPEQKYPYQDVFANLEVTFVVAQGSVPIGATPGEEVDAIVGMPERRLMDAWMASVCNPETMVMNYSEQYQQTIELIAYDDKDRSLAIYEFFRVYPLKIGAIEFNHTASEAAKFSVTFNYDRWSYKSQ